MNGIRTIEDLKDRCHVDPDTACWHWRLCIAQGVPKVTMTINGKKAVRHGRRAAFILSRGVEPPKGHRVWAIPQCKSRDCVNPVHVKSGTRDEFGADKAKSGAWKNLPSKVRAARDNARKAQGKLSLEIAREVRASDESASEWAARLGCDCKTIYAIRGGKRWKENTLQQADVFSWASQRIAA